jgi:amino acid permease
MSIEFLLTIESAILGFVASLIFIHGSITMTGKSIHVLSSTRLGFNRLGTKSLTKQKANYISGALILCLAFFLQLCTAAFPQEWLEYNLLPSLCAYLLAAALFLLVCFVAYCVSCKVQKSTYKAALQARREEREEKRKRELLSSNAPQSK